MLMTKRRIIIVVSAVLAVMITVGAVLALNRKKNNDRVTDTGKSTAEYSSDENKNGDSSDKNQSMVQGVDEIDIGGDFEEATGIKKPNDGKSEPSKSESSKASSSPSGTKKPSESSASSNSESSGADNGEMAGWSPWK